MVASSSPVACRERAQAEVTVPRDGAVGDGRMTGTALRRDREARPRTGACLTRFLFLNAPTTDCGWIATVRNGAITNAGCPPSSAWSPDGKSPHPVFRRLEPIVIQNLGTGTAHGAGNRGSQNITPAFAPDGRGILFARMSDQGVSLYTANAKDLCCVERLTGGRFAENFSPAYSPDGRRVVFVSTRAGGQQIYAMAADGTDQELLVPFDFGDTGNSNAPDWSPDGATIAFHRSRRPPYLHCRSGGRRPA